MSFEGDSTEEQIFKALISRRDKFKVRCIEFDEADFQKKLVKDKAIAEVREKRCKARAKNLYKFLLTECI